MGKITAQELGSLGTITATLSGNASTATKLATGRTISLTGDVTGTSAAFDGSGNLSFATTLANSGATAGTYKSVTVDAKGRVTAGTNPTTLAGYGITDAAAKSHSHTGYSTATNVLNGGGDSSVAEGASTVASGFAAHAEGEISIAEGICSHAEGESTRASGNYSHAEGECAVAQGESSHAEGSSTSAIGDMSHAANIGTIAQGLAQTAIGKYNIAQGTTYSSKNTDLAFIIGNGTQDTIRSNALTVDWIGNLVTSGTTTSTRLISTASTGTSPLSVTSTTVNTNLNADLLDGYHATTASQANSIAVADANNNINAAKFTASSQFVSNVATGTAPLSITSTTLNTNLNADMVDGYHASTASAANTIVAQDSSGDVNCRLLRQTYSADSANIAYVLGQVAVGSGVDNYARPTSLGKLISLMGYYHLDSGGDYYARIPMGPGSYMYVQGSWNTQSSTSGRNVTFPIAFPNACIAVTGCREYFVGDAAGSGTATVFDVSRTGFSFNIGNGTNTRMRWIAIGY